MVRKWKKVVLFYVDLICLIGGKVKESEINFYLLIFGLCIDFLKLFQREFLEIHCKKQNYILGMLRDYNIPKKSRDKVKVHQLGKFFDSLVLFDF